MIRSAKYEDLPRIAEIHISGWRYAYKGIISDIELYKKRTVINTYNSLEKQFNNGLNIHVFEDDETEIIMGFILHGNCRDENKENSYEAYALYVQPEFTNKGIGTALMNEIKKIAVDNKKTELIIWVLENNKIGRSFYNMYGFIEDGEVKEIKEWNEKEIRMALTIA